MYAKAYAYLPVLETEPFIPQKSALYHYGKSDHKKSRCLFINSNSGFFDLFPNGKYLPVKQAASSAADSACGLLP